ncbi:hypothetical protein QBC37DRAFT_16031 [Rhypophila decipiens]|uniref:Uncharacterized protein n=1 Tax=Rhypophila decipiens TaxID=261697 RepID=A0AAN6YH79_9PEZI|nr:hypothetical protein QBC37DRAFT_16031 [Rhypophila decipiens]
MEPQPQDKEHHHPRTSAPTNATTTLNTRSPLHTKTDISSSVPVLRFPRPQGSRRLANWVSNSSPDLLQLPTMSDTNSLADSAYLIVQGPGTDSDETALTESTGSLPADPRPHDIQSWDGSEGQYDTDSDGGEESDSPSQASSIRYAEEVLHNPSSLLPANNQSIELREVEVKQLYTQGRHTIQEFSEEETEALAKDFGMANSPKRLNASIILDMANGALFLEEPLRILYVGPSEPKRDIILKLGSAIWASPANGTEATFGRHREGVYNLVPISSFGETPELDLMEASQYQIKVDHCTSISRKSNTSTSDARPEQYSLTFGHDAHYDISLSPFAAHPQWSQPHIAIFFVAQDDTDEDRDTRNLAVEFVSQLGTPSIFISDSHSFEKPTGAWVGGALTAGPHISLSSSDPQEPITPVRLPIDFTSFTNIDPRQMNRNLAHLTGMIEPLKSDDADAKLDEKVEGNKDRGIDWSRLREMAVEIFNENRSASLLVAGSVLFTVLAAISIQFLLGPAWSNQPDSLSGAAGISPHTTPVVTVTSTSLKEHTSTTTVVINVTSTKTVDIGRSQPSTSTLASALSFAGFLSDKPSDTPVEPLTKKTVCSAHVHRPNEILVRLPSATKERWLSKGAVAINVWRREVPLQVQLSSVDEGILINLGQNEAYGRFNVTVVTTKKPKINETLLVDFGRPKYAEAVSAGFQALYDIAKVVSSTTNDAVQMVEDTCAPAAAKLRGEATSIKDHIYEAGKAAQGCYEESIDRVKRSLVPDEMNKFLQETKVQLTRHIKTAQELREQFDKSVLQAQIGSKLWWLKLQGKTEEYAEYQRNASRLLKSTLSAKGKKESPEDAKCNGIFGKRRCKQKQQAPVKAQNFVKDSRWKRKIMG